MSFLKNFIINLMNLILKPFKKKNTESKLSDSEKKKDPDKTDDIYPLW